MLSRESGGDGDAGDAGDADGGNGGNGDGGNTPDQANQADGTSLHAPDIYLASHFMGICFYLFPPKLMAVLVGINKGL